jgi:hypothetical protein
MGVAEEVIRGDRKDPGNVYCWDMVAMNLPGSQDYDLNRPWGCKVRMEDN